MKHHISLFTRQVKGTGYLSINEKSKETPYLAIYEISKRITVPRH